MTPLIPLECLDQCRPLMGYLRGRRVHMYLFGHRLQAHSKLEITIFGKVLRTTQGSKKCGI